MPLTPEQYDSQFGALARYASEPARRQFGWGDRLGAAVDSAQAGLYGIGEAVGSDWAAEQRRRNQVEADYTRQRAAEDTGAPTSYQDVNGVGSGLRWVGGLLVDSAPQLATTVAAGMVAGPLGLSGAAGRLAVAGAAGYPMALGDILQNQREESGRTDLGSAAALAVPYAAADMLGVEGALARGGLTRNAIRSLDNIKGLKGGLARTGASMARTGVEEGGGETLQEVTNQFGRMAVNPNATLFSPDAVERYKESFAGGAAMGGAFGGVGGWRRSGLTAPPRNVDQGPTDLLNTPQRPGLQLESYGPADGPLYRKSADEQVPDSRALMPGQYDLFNPDGSPTYAADRSFSDTNPLRPMEPQWTTSPGAADVAPNGLAFNREIPTGGLRLAPRLDGGTRDMFDGTVRYPEPQVEEPAPAPVRDTATPDMLQENPTAMVPTMFNPAQPPAPVAVAAASSQRGQSIGAVAMNLRSRLVQLGAAADGFTTKLALDISQRLHSLENLQEYVQLQETELEKAQAKLDRKVTGGSNMLTPDEYAAERAKIEDRRFALEAAKELVQEYQRGRTNAQAEEARGRAAPGTQVGKAPQSRATERTMRDQNMAGAVAENDQRVAENAVARTEQARMEILRQVMGSPSRGSAVARVRDALRANGYTNMDLSDQEMAEIRRLGQRRADVRAATVVPPGLAAAQGRLTSRASLENTDASPGEPAAASPAPPAAVAGVQPAGSQRDAGVQPQPLPPANSPATAGEQAASAVPADGERAAALEGVTSEALVKVADTAEDTAEYEGALDELYRRWRDDGDAVAEAFFEKNATVVGFAADMARVRERAGENAPEPKTREGKRGLRMGGVGTGKLSDGAKATDALLRGLGGPKYRTVESAPQGAGTVDVDGVVAEVKKMLPGVEILVFDTPQDAGMASPPGGELAVGTMYQGRIYLFRYAIDSRLEAMRTIFHELFHKGLREMMPRDEYHRAMDRLYAADPEIQRRAHEWGRSPEAKARQEAGMSNRDLRSHAIEEALADMAEDLKTAKPGTIRAIANWMASIAERMGLKDLAQWLRRAQLTEAQKFIEEALQVAAGNPGPQGGEFVPLAQRRAEAFKRWFGDSKVVDAEGKPLVVYHGTDNDFSVFQNAVERGGDPTVAQTGLYFAEESGIADIYGDRNGGNVMPVYLNIRNPLDLNDTSTIAGWKGMIAKAIAPRLAAKVMREEAMRDGMSQSLILPSERDRLEAAGYDGIKGVGGVWIAFRPEQIKSAIGNRGTFDPANPDIRYSTTPPPKFDRADPLGSSTFKRWFGKSKIVTASGKPKVMYHGTARDITAFRAKQAGAIFVTDDPRFAEGFASASENWMRNNGLEVLTPEQRQEAERDAQAQIKEAYPHPKGAFEKAHVKSMLEGVRVWAEGGRLPPGEALDFIRAAAAQFVEGGQNILPLYVKAENPFDFTDPDHVTRVMRAAEAERLAEQDLTLARDLRLVERDFTDGRWSTIEHPIVQRAIRKLGFDGFYVREGGQRNLAVYSPTQLKSATGNNGAFDPANPDIRYSTKTKVASALDQLASQLEEAAPAVARILRRGDVKEIADLIVKHDVRSHVRGEPDMDFWTEQLMGVTRSEDPTLGGEIKRLGRVQYSQARGPKDILKLKVDAQAAQEASGLVDPFITLWDNFKEGKLPAPPEPPQWSDYSDAKDPFYHNERMDNPAYAAAYKAAENNFREYNRAVARLQGEFAAEYGLEPPFYEEDKLYGEPEDHVWSLIFAAANAVGRQEKARADADKAQMQRAVNSAAGVPGRLDGGAMYRTKPLREAEPPKFDRADPLGSSAFKRWFGKSKIVTASGKPLVVYHGGGGDITEFKSAASLTREGAGVSLSNAGLTDNEAIYFTKSPGVAESYALGAHMRGGNAVVYPVYLRIERPLVIPAKDGFWTSLRRPSARGKVQPHPTLNLSAADIEGYRAQGYDGIINEKADEIVVFSPEQIKSAIGNRGTFDPANPDIRYKTKPADKAVAESFAKVPYANTTIGRTIQDALYNIAQSPWALPWTTNDQIAEGYKHIKPVVDINRATGRMAATANRYMEAAAQTAKRWRALADPVQLSMQRVMLQSTMDEMHVSIEDADGKYLSAEDAWKHASNNHLDRTPANRAKFGKLYQEFHALPASAKAVYDQVRKDLETQHEDMLRALRKGVADQYVDQLRRQLTAEELNALANEPADARRAFKDVLSVAGTRSELRALERMYQALRDINAEFGTVRGPYFPLVRFGNHVVVMKSADLQTLEDRAAAAREELQAVMEDAPAVTDPTIEAHDAKVAELRKAYNDLRKAVDTAKQDESKYVVEFHESPAQAERARLELERKNPAATVRKTVRENYYRALEGASPAFLNDLTQTLSAALDSGDGVTAKAKDTALQAMKDMYLRRQPERSALRAELKRMGIEGVQSAQMLRGYAQATRNGAWRISRLTHSGEVLEGLQALSEDRYNADAKHVLNELKARFVGDLVPPEESKVLQSLQNTTYFMHLGLNISYFATNATQAWTTSLPVMAGRHGVVNAANSLTAASKDVIRLLSQATAQSVEENGALVGLQLRLTDDQIRKLAKDEGEAKMLKALTDDGVIDITIKHDLGAISDGAATSTVGRGLQKTMELSSALANYPELYNRLATALAAYRMEAAHRGEGPETDAQVQERAQQYAEKIINRTHFNYSPENAPRMMRSQLGRLVFQFKRYQQGMIYLFAKLIKDATNGDADARRSLAYLLGMTTAVGGVVSLPVAAPIALAAKVLASAYPDDDEPEWLQQWYNGMKDSVGEGVAQALAKGLPTVAGLDLSGKLGQGNLLNPVAFANTDGKKFFSRDYFMAAGFGLLGPSASLVANEAEAVGYLQNGDIVKAAERGAPTFAANIIKAYRRSQEGMTTKAGDTLMEPEEFSLLSNALKAAGFESVKVSDTYDNRSAYMNMLAGRQEARKALLRDYYEAVKAGDSDAQAEARQAIAEFNQRQPADQVKPKDLAASLKQHATRAKETVGGLRVGKRDQDSYNRLMGE